MEDYCSITKIMESVGELLEYFFSILVSSGTVLLVLNV